MELLEYVLRKAGNLEGSGWDGALFKRSLTAGAVFGGANRWPKRGLALVDSEEAVPIESASSSIELDRVGSGGTESDGANSPFFVVDLEPSVKRPFALGADATLRMNREAEALTAFGLRGPLVLDRDGVVGGVPEEDWDGIVVCNFNLDEPGWNGLGSECCFSLYLGGCKRDEPGVVADWTSAAGGVWEWRMGCDGLRSDFVNGSLNGEGLFESLD